ncbi:CDP-alcohol phosphatidyltransferase family protein [Thiohalocapsa marina]|uniref:CDP-diacylglycerol--glycerol-3-phosphate 3-phosphatidyltransferase n=1 Tax=Thiohalocapsa marina TaxID=424902 RepID=A0A5M8FR19_9GAMM|nr:CDP-alcohol phosphatidyltransferase family protein [Thiohalocapsa marina]KAA6185095.1 CDP-alcohol phosphatidyltransferase family protein [Thiohalocapsa marina]
MKARDIPNIISTLRLLAVVPVIYLLVSGYYGWALVLFAVSGVSDGVDGYLAKRFHWQSRLGGLLDPIADKTLLVSCFLVLAVLDQLPLWLALAVVFRDLVILTGGITYHHLIEDVQPAPTRLSKLNTAVQIVLVVAVIANAGPFPLLGLLVDLLIWTCLATTVLSGVQYVLLWGSMAMRKGARKD